MKTAISVPRAAHCAAPRAHLFTPTLARSATRERSRFTSPARRHLSTTPRVKKDEPSSFSFQGMAAPPRLPKEEQEIFESLQRQSTGAFSTPVSERRAPPRINQSPDSTAAEVADAQTTVSQRVDRISTASEDSEGGTGPSVLKEMYDKVIEARGKGEELHPNVVRGAQPEFEGDVNPKTGEVGGPKNEPLRWGASGDWTYNGRATDF
ncbi:hypothetical protein A1O7_00990 [Cladophialophora yegresii CBS 114405]|uniref:Succinate dehydrogenase assembly factor 4, mitochondrial n=1 Tax=Cladophialophora yegresii CBS 114405 TaxID=1182544 RepID=W9W957_9EURO|nr:uncharacterized protein A1O7_00990 [Cladophialophora yegresii CBS 114405]EXJ64652.1 hypothetical protein A1O7_00990 [Cladophialophora yegresii CBS 114405]